MKKRKLLYGIGEIDTDYLLVLTSDVAGKRKTTWRCPFYKKWQGVLARCYSPSMKKTHPAYAGCSMAPSWRRFSQFKAWMETQEWEGLSLDKDILVEGNKVYSPECCVFVPPYLNNLLLVCTSTRGPWSLGVSYDKRVEKYVASVREHGKTKYLGGFTSEFSAHRSWQREKIRIIDDTLVRYRSEKFYIVAVDKAFQSRVLKLQEDLLCGRSTFSL